MKKQAPKERRSKHTIRCFSRRSLLVDARDCLGWSDALSVDYHCRIGNGRTGLALERTLAEDEATNRLSCTGRTSPRRKRFRILFRVGEAENILRKPVPAPSF